MARAACRGVLGYVVPVHRAVASMSGISFINCQLCTSPIINVQSRSLIALGGIPVAVCLGCYRKATEQGHTVDIEGYAVTKKMLKRSLHSPPLCEPASFSDPGGDDGGTEEAGSLSGE